MTALNVKPQLTRVVEELSAMAEALDATQLATLAENIDRAPRLFFSGQGRSGLMIKAITIRLMHIGLQVYVAGESNTPAIGHGDLLVAVSSSAKTQTTLSHIRAARQAGAKVALISAKPAPEVETDIALYLPARVSVMTDQHAGSLFEQTLLIIGDAIARLIQQRRGETDANLDKRHANLQ
ncbi:SIS domain-containing protein [Paramixta manurensis]|uniref:SIS domain-containing protein n=1 Tax=Paramixta manurensis TaxID=2740817 RepID=A0A6M8UU64_9GAMM|nr:SIS domain-containing protein [Erwiniaceae bacterium PD-1]